MSQLLALLSACPPNNPFVLLFLDDAGRLNWRASPPHLRDLVTPELRGRLLETLAEAQRSTSRPQRNPRGILTLRSPTRTEGVSISDSVQKKKMTARPAKAVCSRPEQVPLHSLVRSPASDKAHLRRLSHPAAESERQASRAACPSHLLNLLDILTPTSRSSKPKHPDEVLILQ
jgi:hypothetical protein